MYSIQQGIKGWKYSIDNVFCKSIYPTKGKALASAFDFLENLRQNNNS